MVWAMKLFLDSSILIEYIKGNKTDLLDILIDRNEDLFINHIVFSEFIFHFLAVSSGISPLNLKRNKQIHASLSKFSLEKFIENFGILEMDENILFFSYEIMKRYNLLPNDALIIATSKISKIDAICSFDSDFIDVCKAEEISLISSLNNYNFLDHK
jgi:predicted nucleic acid-binding protein